MATVIGLGRVVAESALLGDQARRLRRREARVDLSSYSYSRARRAGPACCARPGGRARAGRAQPGCDDGR
jgi:hypothetical protein